jgi:NADPH-dependent F420 reductase
MQEERMRITIIGSGRMGRGIGTRLVAGANDVEFIDSDGNRAQAVAEDLDRNGSGRARAVPRGGPIGGEVVILAVHYPAVAGVLEEYGDQLAGKVVVDVTNPVDFESLEGLITPPGSSSAEETAALVPQGARVVKAFNTTFARTLSEGRVRGEKLDVLIAADDDEAKQTVAQLADQGGMRAIDVGPLRRARQLEQRGLLHISLQDRLGTSFASAVKFLW